MRTVSHLKEINENYTEHGKHALWIAWQCFVCVVALLIHAAWPNVLRKVASNRLESIRLYRRNRVTAKTVPYYFPPNCS